MKNNKFNLDNTNGYSETEIAILNAQLDIAISETGLSIDEIDEQIFIYISEKILNSVLFV